MNEVPESQEVLQQALADPSLPGWTETADELGHTFWWACMADIYLGVWSIRYDSAIQGYIWVVAQGRDGDPNKDPRQIAHGPADTPEQAREAATTWYNRRRNSLPKW